MFLKKRTRPLWLIEFGPDNRLNTKLKTKNLSKVKTGDFLLQTFLCALIFLSYYQVSFIKKNY